MNDRNRVDDWTEPYETPQLIGLEEKIVAVYHSCNRTVRKEVRDESTEIKIETERRKFRNQRFVLYSIKSFLI